MCHAIEQSGGRLRSLKECLWNVRQVIISASYHGVVKVLRWLWEFSSIAEDWPHDGYFKRFHKYYVIQSCNANFKHCDQVIKWPDKEEHQNISGRIRKVHGFINCIGVIDGKLFP